MNLSPAWATVIEERGWQAVHWSSVGEPGAMDTTLLAWARDNDHIVITHDLDFGAILAVTSTHAPSVTSTHPQCIAVTFKALPD